LLSPLFELSTAADITGVARGVAFQLVEALGVLERARVADQVKGLEQPERATLRKYGVRFGAYNIYLPQLLKPAPRALAVQLYALIQTGTPDQGLDDLLQLAGSGRTSIPANPKIDPALYRTAGYRVCGERAVRVDILERLADLIRPALAWREGTATAKPPGAVTGGGFTIVNTMTSLTGASGEDFASILRSLGYRMERRPQPIAAVPAPVPTVAEGSETPAPVPTDVAVAPEDAAPVSVSVMAAQSVADEPPVETPETVKVVAAEVEAPATVEVTAAAESLVEPPTAVAAEPAMIEVWRPGRVARPARGRRPHAGQGGAGRHSANPSGESAEASAIAPEGAAPGPVAQTGPIAAAETDKASRPERHPRSRRRERNEQRFERPRRERPPAHAGRHERNKRHEREDRREKAPDPNSPFAKLAALKAQLEADAKERR